MLDVLAYLVFFLVIAGTYALACLGLNLQWGFTGLFNVGVAGFFAIGAYAAALLSGPDYPGLGGLGLPFPIGWAGAMAATAAAALLVGLPALRLRHDFLAITTFGIAAVIQLVALNAEGLTGGPFGLALAPRPLEDWFASPLAYNACFLVILLAVLALCYGALERLVHSPWGRVLKAIREDETAAAALGKNPFRYRLQAFVIGCAVIGLAGATHASFMGFIAPENFLPILTFQVWTMLIVGGSGNNRGAILGALLVWAVWSASGRLLAALLPAGLQVRGASLQIVLIGLVLAGVLLARPRGLLGERIVVSPHARADDRPA